MKIAFVGQKGIPAKGGGVERYVEDLAVRIARDHDVTVYARPYYTDKAMSEYNGVKVKHLPSLKTKHLDAITHTFLGILSAAFGKYDIIHIQGIGPALLAWLPKLINPRVRVVATLHCKDYEHQKWGAFARFMLRTGEKVLAKTADEIVVATKLMRQYVKDEYGKNSHYIPNGTNLYEAVGDEAIKDFGLTKGGYIVAISRLIRHKGLMYLIDAYQGLGNVSKKLVIVGGPAFTDDYEAELKAAAEGNPNIIFTGHQSGEVLDALYDNAYLFVQPSEAEGLSLALLEAMSRRTPVLVSDIAENLEAVEGTALVFKNKNTADLREKLRFAVYEPEVLADKAAAARKRVEQNYNWDLIADDLVRVYDLAKAKNKGKVEVSHGALVE